MSSFDRLIKHRKEHPELARMTEESIANEEYHLKNNPWMKEELDNAPIETKPIRINPDEYVGSLAEKTGKRAGIPSENGGGINQGTTGEVTTY